MENIEDPDEQIALLVMGAENGNIDMVSAAVMTGVDINGIKDDDDRTALEHAAANNHFEVCQYLLDNEAAITSSVDVNIINLFHAAKTGDLELCQSAVEAGALINTKNSEGRTALDIATRCSHLSLSQYLMSRGAKVEDIEDANEKTRLMFYGAEKGDTEMVSKAILAGAEIDENGIFSLDAMAPSIESYLSFMQTLLKTSKRNHEFVKYLGRKEEMFHLRKANGKSLMELLKENGQIMTKEMMTLNDILIEVDKIHAGEEHTRVERVVNQLKIGLPSSPWLRDTINNVKERFSWSTGKFYTMVFISFMVNIVGGWSSYTLDVYTDINFAQWV